MARQNTPFDPDNQEGYRSWRETKLAGYPTRLEQLMVEVEDLRALTVAEYQALMERIRKTGMALYASANAEPEDKELIRALGQQFGLTRLDHNMCADNDAISSLTVQSDALHRGYIPYSNRPIAWHTDGYYNDLEHQIQGLLLHCVRPATRGGANQLLDHEILYMELRDQNPDYIRALMHPRAMTIPANRVEGEVIRPDRTGPVFSIRQDGRLHMRYTDRSRSIIWRDDPLTGEAVAALKKILKRESRYRFEGRLQPGEGLICSNVLHTRSGFDQDDRQRLLYRARYFDPIRDYG